MVAAADVVAPSFPLLYASSNAEYFIIKLCISFRFASRSEMESGDATTVDGVGVVSSSSGLFVVTSSLVSSWKGISTAWSFKLAFLSGASLFPLLCWGFDDLRGRNSEWFVL